MVGPSARGSLKGTPSSITSAPASASAITNFSVASSEGSPAVMYATIPSSPASRKTRNRSWILVFNSDLHRKFRAAMAIGYEQSIMPRTYRNVLRLFPSAGILHQQMIGAPPAEVAAEVVFVGDGVSVAGVEPDGRKIERPTCGLVANSLFR